MRVGLLGLGNMGRSHLRVLQDKNDISEVFVYDENPSISLTASKARQLESFDSLLEQNLDYCVVALPTKVHAEAALKLAASNVPTLLEKPVALSLDEAIKIESAYSRQNVFCAIGHVERFNPALTSLKSKIAEGMIGRPIQIKTQRVGPFPRRILDVGVALDLASHDIDIVHWITGSDYAEMSWNTSRPLGGEHEDVLLGSGRLSSGLLVNHEVNWITPTKSRFSTVLGEEGMLVADSLRAELRLFRNGLVGSEWGAFSNFRGVTEGEEIKFVVPVREPLLAEHEAMAAELLSPGSTNLASIEDGLKVMRVLDGIMK